MTLRKSDILSFVTENGDDEDLAQIKLYLDSQFSLEIAKFGTVAKFMEWAKTELHKVTSVIEVEKSNKKFADAVLNSIGLPSEPDLEDALNWADCAAFTGSEKQIKWARSIAANNTSAIALAWKQGAKVPTDAKWWIENRSNIVISLPL